MANKKSNYNQAISPAGIPVLNESDPVENEVVEKGQADHVQGEQSDDQSIADKVSAMKDSDKAAEVKKFDLPFEVTPENCNRLLDMVKYYAHEPHRGNYKAIELLKSLGVYDK